MIKSNFLYYKKLTILYNNYYYTYLYRIPLPKNLIDINNIV